MPPVLAARQVPPPAVAAGSALDIRGACLTYGAGDGAVEALQDVDLGIAPGEFVSLIGPSGCGKTTLLRVVADLESLTAGSVSIDGATPRESRERRGYGYVFQAPALQPWRSVLRNVELPLEVAGVPRTARRERALAQLDIVGLAGFEKRFPWQLSGGMQQRVSIARALTMEPRLLLMDEPFGALDEITRDHLNEVLFRLWEKTGKTVLFVTHSIAEAVFLSTRIVVMSPRPGRIAKIIDSDFGAGRRLSLRETPAFLDVAARVRRALQEGHSYDD